MEQFWFYVKLGLDHVLDFSAYDHILFLTALAIPFLFKDWKKVLLLATVFTIAHCLSLALSAFGILTVNVGIIEFLIPITIALTALYNLWTVKKANGEQNFKVHLVATTFFGLIHGFGFSNYFKMMIGKEEDKLFPLLEFALGIEAAQIIIVLGILIIGTILQNFFRVTRRDWILVCSSVVIGFAIQMMLDRVFW